MRAQLASVLITVGILSSLPATTLAATNPYAGTYSGSFAGSNSTGARYTGTGTATVKADGTATFSYTARPVPGAGNVFDTFTGKVDNFGTFTGTDRFNEPARGVMTLKSNALSCTITWVKHNTKGGTVYTSTEVFTLKK